MEMYRTKFKKISGGHASKVLKNALDLYKKIKSKTKRQPYIRSAYFDGQKIFLESFWHHIYQKQNIRDKSRRLKYFSCAIDLIQNGRCKPIQKNNPHHLNETFYRFFGKTPNDEIFVVQIKENISSNQKWLMSVFPWEK